jgi:hypothetical protein
MALSPGNFLSYASNPNIIIPGNTVSCSSPSYSSGVVKANPLEDWTGNPEHNDDMIYVDFTASSGPVIWVPAANCTVTG